MWCFYISELWFWNIYLPEVLMWFWNIYCINVMLWILKYFGLLGGPAQSSPPGSQHGTTRSGNDRAGPGPRRWHSVLARPGTSSNRAVPIVVLSGRANSGSVPGRAGRHVWTSMVASQLPTALLLWHVQSHGPRPASWDLKGEHRSQTSEPRMW